MPTLSARPTSPPSCLAQRSIAGAIAAASETSTTSVKALPPSPVICATVLSAASLLTSMQATCAPSRANSTDIARPLPIGGSSSMILRWPAPTTMMRRPARRPWLLARPSDSACSEADGSIFRGACVVVDIGVALPEFLVFEGEALPRRCERSEDTRSRQAKPGSGVIPHPEERPLGRVLKDAGRSVASWFETRFALLTLRVQGSIRAHKIALADFDAVVAQEAVGDGGVEVELGQGEVRDELLALHRHRLVP